MMTATQESTMVQLRAYASRHSQFGTAGRVEEYDSAGRVVWQIDGNPGYVFRAQRVRSLYNPGTDLTR